MNTPLKLACHILSSANCDAGSPLIELGQANIFYAAASAALYSQLSASCGAGLPRIGAEHAYIVDTPLLPPCRILGYLQVVGQDRQ